MLILSAVELLFFLYVIQYMSIGNNTFGKTEMKYDKLKFIELSQVSFEHMKELKVVLRLILNSPNLEELQIAVSLKNLYQS